MAKKLKEYDYLYISARIHAMETKLLTRDRMERMLSARSAEEAAKVLAECGYGDFPSLTPAAIEQTLDAARLSLFAELRRAAPDPAIVDVFCIKYDYHNAKVLVKAEATGQSPDELLLDAGRYPAARLKEDYVQGDLSRYSATFAQAVAQAKELLASSGDPQAADLLLDQAYYTEMLAAAKAARSSFLEGYVRLSIDSVNLRSVVRAARMGKGPDFLRRVLLPGGNVKTDSLLAAGSGAADLAGVFAHTYLTAAAQEGAEAMRGGSLTQFERLCDNALTAYLSQGKRVAFGEHPLIGYLYAKESELTTIRIILTGRLAGLDAETIRERLRESYV